MAALTSLKAAAFPGHSKSVNHVAWNPSGAMLASSSNDSTTRVWTHRAGGLTSLMELAGHAKAVMQLAWSPTAEGTLATASNDKTVRLWDVRQATEAGVVECKVIVTKSDGSEQWFAAHSHVHRERTST